MSGLQAEDLITFCNVKVSGQLDCQGRSCQKALAAFMARKSLQIFAEEVSTEASWIFYKQHSSLACAFLMLREQPAGAKLSYQAAAFRARHAANSAECRRPVHITLWFRGV